MTKVKEYKDPESMINRGFYVNGHRHRNKWWKELWWYLIERFRR